MMDEGSVASSFQDFSVLKFSQQLRTKNCHFENKANKAYDNSFILPV
jgi:hypothetical protein